MRTNNGQGNRNDKLIKEDIHDPYMKRSKPVSPSGMWSGVHQRQMAMARQG
jgi:hypothetical protein